MYSSPHKCQTVGEAFELGRTEAHIFRAFEAREAIASWKDAESDHSQTSFWGFEAIRKSRAYWLGVLRQRRELILP